MENKKQELKSTSFNTNELDYIVDIVKYEVAENNYNLTKQKYESLMLEDYTKYYELIKMDEAIYDTAKRRYEMIDRSCIINVKRKLKFYGLTPYEYAKQYNLVKGLQ